MAILTAQYIIQMTSGIPADAVINTWHFLTPSEIVLPAELDDVVAALKQFYDSPSPSGPSVDNLLSVDASNQLRRIKIHKRTAIKPEPTLREEVYTTSQAGVGGSFPHEVALCLSSRSVPDAGVVQRRRRGRVYIGPLSDHITMISRAGGDVRPSASARSTLASAAGRLRDRTGPAIWSTYSTVDGAAVPVVNGWVDDAYDTQRRRGTKALVRTTW